VDGGEHGGGKRAVAWYDCCCKAAASRGGGGLAGIGPPPQGCGQARSGSQPSRDRGAAGAPTDGDSAPGRGQSRGRSGSAPERVPEVLVMREDGCMMSQCPAHDAEASTSHVTPPASDVDVSHPK
jgi:hypothetical protein